MGDIKFYKLRQALGCNSAKGSENSCFFMPQSLWKLLISYLVIYTLVRVLFLGWNFHHFSQFSVTELLQAFGHGLRFDLLIVGPMIFLTFLLALVLRNKYLSVLLFAAFLFFQTGLLFINFVDIELVNFMGRRFTKSSLYLAGEGSFFNITHYTFLTMMTLLGFMAFLFFQWTGYQKLQKDLSLFSKKKIAVFIFIGLLFAVVTGRGGFQYKPISFVDAKVLPHPYAHHLVMNSGFTFLKSFGKKQFEKVKYFSEDQMLSLLNLNQIEDSQLQALKVQSVKIQPVKDYNLVIFILEGLSAEYINEKQMPFFSQLKSEGIYFDKAYANGRRSIEGIAAILSGIPALMEEPFLNSEFATNDFVGLGNLLKKKNYHTSFFHGAKNGSMRFDSFSRASGFTDYYGLNEYISSVSDIENDHDQVWGIYDKPFLKYTCDQLSRQTQKYQQPLASVIFTLSSHQPFKVPDDFLTEYLTAGLPMQPEVLKTVTYLDQSLKTFFDCLSEKKDFEKTIFIFVSDHTGPKLDPKNDNLDKAFSNQFHIPILFYSKNKSVLKGLDNNQYAQQIDLLPTLNDLFDLGLLNKNHLARSLYVTGPKTIALLSDQHYALVGDTDLSDDRLKAIQQYFSEGLYDNRLYFPQGSGK